MPRQAYLPKAIYDYDFKKLSKIEKNPRAIIRMLGMSHLQKGNTITATAQLLMVRQGTVRDWIQSFSKYGLQGLYDSPKSGRRSKLSKEELDELPNAIEELQHKRKGGRIKGLDIIELIFNKYNVKYTLNGIYTLLHKIRMSWVSARSKHPHSKAEDQELFKKNLGSC